MVVLCVLPADAKVISGAVAGANLPISEDTVIASGAWVFTDKMTIEKSVVLENYGRIETDVFLDSVNLYIKNYADFNSDFYLNDGANVFQIISDGDSFNLIDFNVDYGLVIDCVYGGFKLRKSANATPLKSNIESLIYTLCAPIAKSETSANFNPPYTQSITKP